MKKIKVALLTIVMIPLLSMTVLKVDLVTKYLFDNRVSIKVPVDFKEMSKSERINGFQRGETPVAAFVDKTETVYITFLR